MNKQENYVFEAMERQTVNQRAITTLDGDDPTLTERERILCENAYRRGYFHGYESAHNYRGTLSPAKLSDWIVRTLYKWRYSKHGGRFETPPEPK